jgi:hypothetical protein
MESGHSRMLLEVEKSTSPGGSQIELPYHRRGELYYNALQDEEIIHVISARAAESHERRAFEEAYEGAETRHPAIATKED